MNDRASAAPPVQFLGPEERAVLERPLSDEWMTTRSQQQQQQQQQPGQQKRATLLGQVWDGVRGRFRLRKDAGGERDRDRDKDKEREKAHKALEGIGMGPIRDERPTREEVMANYQNLVESGFFTAHAIQSTRQPAPRSLTPARPVSSPTPGMSRMPGVRDSLQAYPLSGPGREPHTPSSHAYYQPSTPRSSRQAQIEAEAEIQWPLSSPTRPPPSPPLTMLSSLTPPPRHLTSPVCSPASASSRGTKRAADDATNIDPPTPKKKLRKSYSRDIAIPKLRSVASRRNIITRSFSGSSKNNHSNSQSSSGRQATNRLAKRVFSRLPGSARDTICIPERGSSRRHGSSSADKFREANTRVLRPRKTTTEPLCVVPDVNRGIPNVPAIPAKFVQGEDVENDEIWMGVAL